MLGWGLLFTPAAESAFVLLVASVFVTFALQTITGNWSWVDRYWSIVPALYSAIAAFHAPTPRTILAAVLSAVWAVRLSYNFFRRGGYNPKEEDYRWQYVRRDILHDNKTLQLVFSFFFVSLFQNLLLLALASPALLAANGMARPGLNWLDIFAAAVFALCVAGETYCDQLQWNFQEAKWAAIRAKKPLSAEQKQGFLSTGPWRISRHPNYFCEIGAWCAFYLFSVASSGLVANLCIIGPIVLVGVIVEGNKLAERISASKYPLYKVYQLAVGCIFPTMPHCDPRLCGCPDKHKQL